MSQTYKFKSLEIAKNGKKQLKTEKDLNKLTVFEVGETKTVDFELLDGKRQNFAYTHYLTSWLDIKDDERFIKILFATHLITIKGYCLDEIYDALTSFNLKYLKANDERYLKTFEEGKTFVTEIEIAMKKDL